MIWKLPLQDVQDSGLGLMISFRHQVNGVALAAGSGMTEAPQMNSAGSSCSTNRYPFDYLQVTHSIKNYCSCPSEARNGAVGYAQSIFIAGWLSWPTSAPYP